MAHTPWGDNIAAWLCLAVPHVRQVLPVVRTAPRNAAVPGSIPVQGVRRLPTTWLDMLLQDKQGPLLRSFLAAHAGGQERFIVGHAHLERLGGWRTRHANPGLPARLRW